MSSTDLLSDAMTSCPAKTCSLRVRFIHAVAVVALLAVSGQAADLLRAKRFDKPNLNAVVQTVSAGDATITIYKSEPAEKLWISERDNVVYTAGTSPACYFYPQLPTHNSVLLCSATKYYNLDHSQPIRARINGLYPDTAYYYRVNDSAELVRFRTQPLPGTFAPFQFTLTGDSQGPYDHVSDRELNKDRIALEPWPQCNDASTHRFNVTTDAMRRHVAPDFSLSIGDIIEDARYTVQWEREFFGWLKYYLTHAPVFMAMGNHEQMDSRSWQFLVLPLTPRERLPGRYFYAFTWGQAHFIAVDFNRQWDQIFDIDAVPVTYRYKITAEVLAQLEPHLPQDGISRLAQHVDHEYGAATLKRHLEAIGFTEQQNRTVRTAALTKGSEAVDISEVRLNASQKQIQIRNLKLGRVSIATSHDDDLWQYQWQWLEEELRASADKKYVFVFSHHPFCYGGPIRKIPDGGDRGFDELFEKYQVTATFSGHWHGFAHNQKNNVHYFQVGGLSDEVFSELRTSPNETFVFHRHGACYTVVDVEHDAAVLSAYGRDNQLFYTQKLAPRK